MTEGIDRTSSQYWKAYEIRHEFHGLSETPETVLLHQRCADSHAEFQRQLSIGLYGDTEPYIPITRWQRFRNWLGDNRITNAWLVLIGREDIDREYR